MLYILAAIGLICVITNLLWVIPTVFISALLIILIKKL